MDNKDFQVAQKFYSTLPQKVAETRTKFNRALTLAEKILFAHMAAWSNELPVRGKTPLDLYPDRVAMQDATAQMALLQFISTLRDTVAVPSSIHCDHLIQAYVGAEKDLQKAVEINREVYDFLKSSGQRYGIDFWGPGAGIIHQVVLEQYAFPGALIIGTDSHTPNGGGLGMLAIGVGGADASEVMAGAAWGVQNPKLIGVHLKGKLNGWTSAKDVILKVAGMLTVKGGTGKIVEYFGEGTESISCTGKATITNMGAELGATTSVFPYDSRMAAYLRATKRANVADLADKLKEHLTADAEVLKNPSKYYDEVIEIDLSTLEPQWVGPHTPDLLRKVSEMKDAVKKENYPDQVTFALIGSCTNSSYEDISRSANIAKQAQAKGLKTKIPLMVTPGSTQVYETIKRDGLLKIFEDVGATVLANACGPCIGQWKRDDIKKGEKNSIVTSYNRNFSARNDGNDQTCAFIGSPEIVTALAFNGKLSFNPMTDEVVPGFKFNQPTGEELPKNGYVFSLEGLTKPVDDLNERKKTTIAVSPTSDRLQLLPDFAAPNLDSKDFSDLVVLLKAKGKCTTDHISAAGPWLKYRGHLERISDNMFLGANNIFTTTPGTTNNVLTGEKSLSIPAVARAYKAKGQNWIVIGDENYGEGSSREHAAMSPRYLGCKAVIVRSFARIHETNLKKQGVLPFYFVNPADYDLITEDSRVSFLDLKNLKPAVEVKLEIKNSTGTKTIQLKHTMTEEQLGWFRAGSALKAFGMKK